ncbi:SDR family NAD(P)-dependent oxidoreductase [Flavobacteriaceae bacterium]|jgi:3-oxoacyl-[acyl-carrier protein] reductase|nr:SDR family NAD(P)-dependent oxidoreductase [Flavobacteriaceae bacterium]MDB4235305.1 SDR family NAD(P)-dependent oxidoreductase [bacterium]MDB4062738.1 SDR family NAD(P)-dependent oxidoreductase [Flavobacteriaceae bacterium]MDB4228974.1 SDR family NAD(P)-dependent oxidoreductase [Flavobacteriaceae bacterium]MDB4255171.1 SDR family NAD(P)-dependent oxidoreductase [Flavobacteriaceae bacterium]
MKKTIVVTGASKGIGFELVRFLVSQGHVVYALSRDIKALVASEKLHPISLDLTDEESIIKFAEQLNSNQISIDALINNAGSLINQSFSTTTKNDFEAIYRVNVFGLASITRLLLPLISSKGHVVNISSMGGIGGSSKFSGLSAYSSSKGAVNILTELLAEEYKETGPFFNGLALGAVQTEMLAKAFPGFRAPLSAGEIAPYIAQFALTGHQFYNGKILPISSSTP